MGCRVIVNLYMSQLLKLLGLLLLLLTAQQGAVVHELSHLSTLNQSQPRSMSGMASDATCALCPAFAQAATAAFSYAFHAPMLRPLAAGLAPESHRSAMVAAVPQARSRGPPSLS